MNIALIGFKSCGKTTLAKKLFSLLQMEFIDNDDLIVSLFEKEHKKKLSCYEIYKTYGQELFRKYEKKALFSTKGSNNCLLSTGSGIILDNENREFLKSSFFCVYLDVSKEILKNRILERSFINLDNFDGIFDARQTIYEKIADITIDSTKIILEDFAKDILRIKNGI